MLSIIGAVTERTDNETQRCETRGRSTAPLDTVHVRRPCTECEKTVYVAEPGERGRDIQILAGDNLTIPSHVVRDILDPKKALDPHKATRKVFRSSIPIWCDSPTSTGHGCVESVAWPHERSCWSSGCAEHDLVYPMALSYQQTFRQALGVWMRNVHVRYDDRQIEVGEWLLGYSV